MEMELGKFGGIVGASNTCAWENKNGLKQVWVLMVLLILGIGKMKMGLGRSEGIGGAANCGNTRTPKYPDWRF